MSRPAPTRAAAGTVLLTLVASVLVASPARAANVATPGNFTGYGFDQCLRRPRRR